MQQRYRPWVPVLLWMGFIFVMSTDAGSANQTSRVIEPLLRWVKPDISIDAIALVHLLVRKCGHLSEYAVLALLVLRALMHPASLRSCSWSWRAAGVAWLMASAYALSDEFHQAFVATRTASPGDVLIDSAGALLGLAVLAGARNLVRGRTAGAPAVSRDLV